VVAVVVTVVLVCAEVVAIGVNAWLIRNHDLGPPAMVADRDPGSMTTCSS
jgi:hypothetical protein